MAELKLPRLLAAAKEFNIGQDTLIEFLVGKGFAKDDLKPTSKLSEDMYRSLQQEFQSDKAAKMKSDQLELPKTAQGEARKKKEEEEISFKSGKTTKKKEEPAAVTPAPAPEPAKEEKEKVEEVVVKAEAPTMEGPKVLKKIDLDAIDSSVRPKKGAKAKQEEPQQVVEKPAKKKKEEEAHQVQKFLEKLTYLLIMTRVLCGKKKDLASVSLLPRKMEHIVKYLSIKMIIDLAVVVDLTEDVQAINVRHSDQQLVGRTN